MHTSTKASCFRILTIVTGILIWLLGAAILGFAIYLRVDYWINQISAADEELETYTLAVYIFIAVGAVIVLFCIIGIYGAARPDRAALVVYLVFLPLALGALIGGGIYIYIYSEEIENSIKNSVLIPELVRKKYGVNDRVTQSIDFMQRELECCGGTSYQDYLTSLWAQDSIVQQPDERKNMAPLTCCSDWQKYINTPYKYCRMYQSDPDTSGNAFPLVNENIFRVGCGVAFVDFIKTHVSKLAAIAFSIVGLLLCAIVFVAALLFFLRRAPPPREDDVVYEMARTQEKSPYPARGGPYANLYQS